MWSPGRTVNRYVLEAPLADDATGAWWRVRHQLLGSLHLLRLSPPESAREPLLQSAQVQAKVQHPQILRATDCFEQDGRICMVTDLVEMQTLADRLRQGPFAPAEAQKLLRGLAAAVGALHARGFLHLDLQPARILWCNGIPRIGDFRLARPVGAPEIRGGNPAYLAPEVLSGGPGDARADIYALGCIAYELLKGTPLFSGADANRRPDLTDLPPSWIALLDRCLRPEPTGRYPHVQALLRAMDEGEGRRTDSEATLPVPPRLPPAASPGSPAAPVPATAAPVAPTPVTVEEESPRKPRPEPEVSTRWGAVLALGLLIGMLVTLCIGVLGAGWFYSRSPEAPAVAMAKADTGKPTPPAATPPSAAASPATPPPAAAPPPRPSRVAAASPPAETPPETPAETPATPSPENKPTTSHTTVTFVGATVPPTVEVTCRGGFRTRARVDGQKVEVDGIPTDSECFMYLKDVVATPAPIHANRNYSCEVKGTTTKCR